MLPGVGHGNGPRHWVVHTRPLSRHCGFLLRVAAEALGFRPLGLVQAFQVVTDGVAFAEAPTLPVGIGLHPVLADLQLRVSVVHADTHPVYRALPEAGVPIACQKAWATGGLAISPWAPAAPLP